MVQRFATPANHRKKYRAQVSIEHKLAYMKLLEMIHAQSLATSCCMSGFFTLCYSSGHLFAFSTIIGCCEDTHNPSSISPILKGKTIICRRWLLASIY